MTTSSSYWFVTAELGRWQESQDGREFVPLSSLHAKAMGTLLTACGINASSWHRYWERRYVSGVLGGCRDCDAAIRRTMLEARTAVH